MRRLINYFTDNDLYTFTCQYYILQKYPRAEVEYTFFDRNKTKYPKGFDVLLREQIDYMKDVKITNKEINFLKKKCNFLPTWYIENFLKGYTFNPSEVSIYQDSDGYLDVRAKGKWYSTIMWEMPILSIISELMHEINDDTYDYDYLVERNKAEKKIDAILNCDGFKIADMGTRRRFDFDHQDMILNVFSKAQRKNPNSKGKFIGTSNVYFAMKYNLTPIGTMSHQIVSFEETVSGVFECNYNVMNKWSEVYDGNNGIYLYDCFGDNVFFNNMSKRMAMLYNGLRVDSGLEEEQIEKIVDKYKQLGIDSTQKQVVFSNGLDLNRAFEIHEYAKGKVNDSYGIGTFLTCDIDNIKPMNIVFKLTKCRITESREWHDCVKLSCTKGKTLGNEDKCKYLLSIC